MVGGPHTGGQTLHDSVGQGRDRARASPSDSHDRTMMTGPKNSSWQSRCPAQRLCPRGPEKATRSVEAVTTAGDAGTPGKL